MEIILVDDGSTDGSGELADRFAKLDTRIRVLHQENCGLSVARNNGLRAATGEYVIFLDSDDEWLLQNGIETMLRESKPCCDLIVFKRVDFWRKQHREDSADYDIMALASIQDGASVFAYLVRTQKFQISACFLMARRRLIIDNGIFFPVGSVDEDISWNLHLWQFVQTVSFHNLAFYGYHHRADSITNSYSLRIFQSNDCIFTKWKTLCKSDCINSSSILSFLANLWVSLGYHVYLLKNVDEQEAIKILKKHKDILLHATSFKARWTALLVKILGVRWATKFLGIYWYLRTLITGNFL